MHIEMLQLLISISTEQRLQVILQHLTDTLLEKLLQSEKFQHLTGMTKKQRLQVTHKHQTNTLQPEQDLHIILLTKHLEVLVV